MSDLTPRGIFDILSQILDPQMESILHSISGSQDSSTRFVYLPDSEDAELGPQQISRLVAITSNKYANACRLASMARAKLKIAESAYKYRYRVSLKEGRNTDEREANAMEAAQDQFNEMVLCQAIVELCESIENSTRIASESARRMMFGADQSYKAEGRFSAHQDSLNPEDYKGV